MQSRNNQLSVPEDFSARPGVGRMEQVDYQKVSAARTGE